MADDLRQTGKPDDQRINVEQEQELWHWATKLGVSNDDLSKAGRSGRSMLKDVKAHLHHRG
jgi:hypothetical protein